jgi:mannose-6-phosphate isomerase-like protein (cupin superfamily)
MPLFTPLSVPRTPIATHNPIQFENGRGAAGFYTPSSEFLGWQVIPWDNKWLDGSPSFISPISHYHLLQEEKFRVKSGQGYWYMRGRQIKLGPGDEITIPRCVAHRFESVPDENTKEPLVILYRYDSQRWEMEERFFRNVLPYMDDCRKVGVAPSLLQLCVFLADCWMPPDLIPVSWAGDYVSCAVNTLLMWAMAFVGVALFGYRRNYVEYYDPEISRRRIAEESRKEK